MCDIYFVWFVFFSLTLCFILLLNRQTVCNPIGCVVVYYPNPGCAAQMDGWLCSAYCVDLWSTFSHFQYNSLNNILLTEQHDCHAYIWFCEKREISEEQEWEISMNYLCVGIVFEYAFNLCFIVLWLGVLVFCGLFQLHFFIFIHYTFCILTPNYYYIQNKLFFIEKLDVWYTVRSKITIIYVQILNSKI